MDIGSKNDEVFENIDNGVTMFLSSLVNDSDEIVCRQIPFCKQLINNNMDMNSDNCGSDGKKSIDLILYLFYFQLLSCLKLLFVLRLTGFVQ